VIKINPIISGEINVIFHRAGQNGVAPQATPQQSMARFFCASKGGQASYQSPRCLRVSTSEHTSLDFGTSAYSNTLIFKKI
jgi:hypothetical protein